MSLPNQDQVNNVIGKKIQGVPFTNVNTNLVNESIGSSSSRIVSDYIFNQRIPIKAPFSVYNFNNSIR
jgi:hypothetical protein